MGCMFSVSIQRKITCVLCDGVEFDYYNNFSEHLSEKHSVENNLKFILAACHLNEQVIETVICKFDESFKNNHQDLETPNRANLESEIVHQTKLEKLYNTENKFSCGTTSNYEKETKISNFQSDTQDQYATVAGVRESDTIQQFKLEELDANETIISQHENEKANSNFDSIVESNSNQQMELEELYDNESILDNNETVSSQHDSEKTISNFHSDDALDNKKYSREQRALKNLFNVYPRSETEESIEDEWSIDNPPEADYESSRKFLGISEKDKTLNAEPQNKDEIKLSTKQDDDEVKERSRNDFYVSFSDRYMAGFCEECNKRFADIRSHRKNFHKIGFKIERSPCDICFKVFQSTQKLRQHNSYVHSNEPCQCPQCGIKLKSKYGLSTHLKTTHQEKKISCRLIDCKVKFHRKSNMEMHYKKVHLGEKSECSKCGESVRSLKWHMSSTHNKIFCDVCGIALSGDKALEYHLKSKHDGDRQLVACQFCDKKVFQIDNHIKRKHSKKAILKTFSCPDERCSKMFASSQWARKHNESNHLQMKSRCPTCGNMYKNVEVHIREVHKKKHACDQCQKPFRSSYDLKLHISRIHLKQNRKSVCPHCGKSICKLTEHINTVHANMGSPKKV